MPALNPAFAWHRRKDNLGSKAAGAKNHLCSSKVKRTIGPTMLMNSIWQVWNNKERQELASSVSDGFVLFYKTNSALHDGPPSIKKLQLRMSSAETHRFIECDNISAPQRIQCQATQGESADTWYAQTLLLLLLKRWCFSGLLGG